MGTCQVMKKAWVEAELQRRWVRRGKQVASFGSVLMSPGVSVNPAKPKKHLVEVCSCRWKGLNFAIWMRF